MSTATTTTADAFFARVRNPGSLRVIVRTALQLAGIDNTHGDTWLAIAYRIERQHPALAHWLAAANERRWQLRRRWACPECGHENHGEQVICARCTSDWRWPESDPTPDP